VCCLELQDLVAAAPAATAATAATTRTAVSAATALVGRRAEAVTAVHRAVTARLERDLRFLAAAGAGGTEHLAALERTATATTESAAAPSATFRASRRSAVGAAPRGVGETFGVMELLVTGAEDEGIAAIGTGQGLVGISHRRASSMSVGSSIA
jgi:hypothetical protein